MKLTFEQNLLYETSFEGLGDIEEQMMRKGLTDSYHDITGYCLAVSLFLLAQVITQIRATLDKKARAKSEEKFLAELDKRFQKYADQNITAEAKNALALIDMQRDGILEINFDPVSEKDLSESFETAINALDQETGRVAKPDK